jgi:hypothetical protein
MTRPPSPGLAMIPDTGERYLRPFLFEGFNEGPDDDGLTNVEAANG